MLKCLAFCAIILGFRKDGDNASDGVDATAGSDLDDELDPPADDAALQRSRDEKAARFAIASFLAQQ
jgi:hypothetical protein